MSVPDPPTSPSLVSITVSVDVKHHVSPVSLRSGEADNLQHAEEDPLAGEDPLADQAL